MICQAQKKYIIINSRNKKKWHSVDKQLINASNSNTKYYECILGEF